jgi:chromosome segregation ATPase
MIQEDTELERLDSLTVRHLRKLRRSMDEYFDLLKRSVEMDGRIVSGLGSLKIDMEGQLNEVRSGLILLENRSLTALEHDARFRDRMNQVEDSVYKLRAASESMTADMGAIRTDVDGLKTNIADIGRTVDQINAKLDARTDAFGRAFFPKG